MPKSASTTKGSVHLGSLTGPFGNINSTEATKKDHAQDERHVITCMNPFVTCLDLQTLNQYGTTFSVTAAAAAATAGAAAMMRR